MLRHAVAQATAPGPCVRSRCGGAGAGAGAGRGVALRTGGRDSRRTAMPCSQKKGTVGRGGWTMRRDRSRRLQVGGGLGLVGVGCSTLAVLQPEGVGLQEEGAQWASPDGAPLVTPGGVIPTPETCKPADSGLDGVCSIGVTASRGQASGEAITTPGVYPSTEPTRGATAFGLSGDMCGLLRHVPDLQPPTEHARYTFVVTRSYLGDYSRPMTTVLDVVHHSVAAGLAFVLECTNCVV